MAEIPIHKKKSRRCDVITQTGSQCKRNAVSAAFPPIDLSPHIPKTDNDVTFRCGLHMRDMQPAVKASTQLGGYIAICEIPAFRAWINGLALNPICPHGRLTLDWANGSVCAGEAPGPLLRMINARGTEHAILWLAAVIAENRISRFERRGAIS